MQILLILIAGWSVSGPNITPTVSFPTLAIFQNSADEDRAGRATPRTGTSKTDLRDQSGTDSASEADPAPIEFVPVPSPASRRVWWVLGIYCLLIVAGSLCGGWLPSRIRLTHTRMQLMISVIGGLMLGIGMFHMLPHAIVELGASQVDRAVWWAMIGLVVMFFLLRTFHFHNHDVVEDEHDHDCGHDHDHNASGAHSHHGHHGHSHGHVHELSWLGVFIGLALHTMIDGLALAASIQADAIHGDFWLPFGLGTFLAVFLHKPLDAISITSLMKAAGWSTTAQMGVNLAFAAMCPLGACLFFVGVAQFSGNQATIIGCALAFSAGVFLCISLSDLLPEMELHSHNRVQLSLALLLGIALAWGIGFLEPAHSHAPHDHGHQHPHVHQH